MLISGTSNEVPRMSILAQQWYRFDSCRVCTYFYRTLKMDATVNKVELEVI